MIKSKSMIMSSHFCSIISDSLNINGKHSKFNVRIGLFSPSSHLSNNKLRKAFDNAARRQTVPMSKLNTQRRLWHDPFDKPSCHF